MYEEPKDKPIRGLLQDITAHNETFRKTPRGLVSPKFVDRVITVTAMVSLLLTSTVFLGMVWEALDLYLGLRCIGSVGVVLIAMLSFRAMNTYFD